MYTKRLPIISETIQALQQPGELEMQHKYRGKQFASRSELESMWERDRMQMKGPWMSGKFSRISLYAHTVYSIDRYIKT